MKDFFYLKLLDRLKPVFRMAGIDYPVMRRILQVKLVMNARRSSTVIARENADGRNNFLASLGMYAFMGLFIGIFMLFDMPLFLKMNVVLGMVVFIVLTTMISDFSSVLLDVQDKAIILTRPVDAKTLNAAKLLHIVYYLVCITGAIAGVGLIMGLIKYGPLFFLTMLAVLVLISCFTILFTSILYFAILRLFSGEKLKDIINYFQIALSIFMTVAYQLMGRIFNFVDMNMQIHPQWWSFLLPSSWFAAPFSIFFSHEHGPYYVILSLTGVVVPVLALLLYVKVAAPAFERNLQKLTSTGGRTKPKKGRLMRGVSDLICYHRDEKVFFKFTCRMLKNERKLKLRLFPNLTLGIIMPFVMMISFASRSGSFSESLSDIASGQYYLYLYISLLFFPSLLPMLAMSESFRGAWIYRAMPIESPGPVLKGALKAFIYKYTMPFFLLNCVIFTALCGFKILPDLLLIFMNLMILTLVMFKFSQKELPFYKDFPTTQSAGNIVLFFISLVLCGALFAAHYLLKANLPYGLALNLAVSLLIFVILWLSSFRFEWKDIITAAS